MNIEIADRLVGLRRDAGLSQEDLAAKLGVSRQAISKWERAESSPDTDNLIALAKLYGVSLDALLLNGGAATQAAPEEPQAPEYEQYDPQRYDSDPSLYEQQLNWEAGDEARRKEQWQRTRHALLTFPFPVLVSFLYLVIGFLFGWWHPGWLLFFTIPIYYGVVGGAK